MFTRTRISQIMAAAAIAIAGGILGLAAAPAGAWPIPLTADDINFLNATRGNFPGNDDQLLFAGKQACRLLYTGQGAQAATACLSSATSRRWGMTTTRRFIARAGRGA